MRTAVGKNDPENGLSTEKRYKLAYPCLKPQHSCTRTRATPTHTIKLLAMQYIRCSWSARKSKHKMLLIYATLPPPPHAAFCIGLASPTQGWWLAAGMHILFEKSKPHLRKPGVHTAQSQCCRRVVYVRLDYNVCIRTEVTPLEQSIDLTDFDGLMG